MFLAQCLLTPSGREEPLITVGLGGSSDPPSGSTDIILGYIVTPSHMACTDSQGEESLPLGRNESLGFSNTAPEVVWMPHYSSVEYKSRHCISSDIVGMPAPHCSWAE